MTENSKSQSIEKIRIQRHEEPDMELFSVLAMVCSIVGLILMFVAHQLGASVWQVVAACLSPFALAAVVVVAWFVYAFAHSTPGSR